jgi:hypothetical protein
MGCHHHPISMQAVSRKMQRKTLAKHWRQDRFQEKMPGSIHQIQILRRIRF